MAATGRAADIASLLLWDAPFVPVPPAPGDDAGPASGPSGVALAEVESWPRGARLAAAVQLLAATVFLFERGWYPSRRLLRGARVGRGPDGVRLTLPRLPGRRLDEAGVQRAGRSIAPEGRDVRAALVAPLLATLVPERREAMRAACGRRPEWEATGALLEALLDGSRGTAVLAHPEGQGRALWARRLDLPDEGAVWVEEPGLIDRLVAAARLVHAEGCDPVEVLAGAFDEPDLVRRASLAAASDRAGLVLTTLASPLARPLALAAGEEAIWLLAADAGSGAGWARRAVELGGQRAALAADVLALGARRAFAGPPETAERRTGLEGVISPGARRLLGLLRAAPAGLTDDDLEALAGPARLPAEELERLRLAWRGGGAWLAAGPPAPQRDIVRAMAEQLPASSPRRALARALTCGDTGPLLAWCDAQLEAEHFTAVLEVASPAADSPEVALRCAEAALATGRPGDAQALLDRVAVAARGECWHALAAWRAELAFEADQAADGLGRFVDDGLPARVAARLWLVRAERERRAGDRLAEARSLARATSAGIPPLAAAAIHAAAAEGAESLRELIRQERRQWSGDTLCRALHLMGYRCFEAGAWAAAATAYRAALRAAGGENFDLLARVHADLAAAYILLERPVSADRHLLLAERLFSRCGSPRAARLTRATRAVVACDRLDVKLADELRRGLGLTAVTPPYSGAWLDEMEEVRVALARGDAAAAQRRLPAIEAGIAPFLDRTTFRQDMAELRAHLALALGDLRSAAEAVAPTAGTDRELVMAVVAADRGEAPRTGLPTRWGLAITARLLALWRSDRAEDARELLARALGRSPREAAVGFARFVVALGARRERLGPEWAALRNRAAAVLRTGDLAGWLERLSGGATLDTAAVVRALDGAVNAGSDALRPERLAGLGEALGLSGIEARSGGRLLSSWGRVDGDAAEVTAGGLTLRGGGPASAAATAALELLARFVVGRGADPGFEGARGGELVGASTALDEVRRLIGQWAPLPATVLIQGEPGTGKELVARGLHRHSGRRGEFVAVNCAGIPAALLETELFGAVRGAYTGADRDRAGLVEAAEGGTLFLDEVAELPTELQAKLLRLLQEREVRRLGATRARRVDVRFVAASNRDLAEAMREGRFRQDLYYRLAVAVIAVPPLRDRPDDVDALARHFVARYAEAFHRPGVTLAAATLEALRLHAWPGNVRELELVVQRAVAAARPGEALGPDRFPGVTPVRDRPGALATWALAHEDLRRRYFSRLLEETGGNRSEAARRAGMSRQALLYHLRTLGLSRR